MTTMPVNPLQDLKKLGEILMRRTSEKEYYRFLRIQEQFHVKWQTAADKFNRLKNDYDKCLQKKEDLQAELQHICDLWEKEKQTRQSVESERNRFLLKMNRTYELLRYDQHMYETMRNECNVPAAIEDSIRLDNHDRASTGSLLSEISGISDPQTDDDYLNRKPQIDDESLIDSDPTDEASDDSTELMYSASQLMNHSMLEETFRVNNEHNEMESSGAFTFDPVRDEQIIYTSTEIETVATIEPDKNPIYERIDEILTNATSDQPQQLIEQKPILNNNDVNIQNFKSPRNCHHSFSHRPASRSVTCFLCFKKFRFGILAFKCNSCNAYAHHDCKQQLKAATKSRRLPKGKKLFVSECAPIEGISVPTLIVHCVNEVEIRGLSERGIYRVSGSEKEIKALYDRYQKTDELPNLSRVDMHVICGCIKNFLRNLREPLIPTYQWIAFSNAVVNHVDDSINGEIQKAIQLEIELLPKANRETLAFLVLHLKRVAKCPEVQMPISNLAKVFGPTVVGYSKIEPDYAEILGETVIQQNVMQQFLTIPSDYWYNFVYG